MQIKQLKASINGHSIFRANFSTLIIYCNKSLFRTRRNESTINQNL
jgi:hypothetical protein